MLSEAGLPISHYRRHRTELVNILKGQHPLIVTDKHGQRNDTVVRISERLRHDLHASQAVAAILLTRM